MKQLQGFIPPHDNKLEEAVIGAMLVSKQGLDDAMQVLRDPGVFYKHEHVQIFTAIQNLYDNSEAVDMLTVSAKLRAMKADVNDLFLIELMQTINSSAHIEVHARLLLQYKMRRMVVAFNAQITALAMDESVDVFDLMARWTKEFDKVNDLILTGRKTQTIAETLKDLGKRIEVLSKATGETPLTGVHTGFKNINAYTGGYQPGDMVVLAARPGMGKTSKVLKTVVENAKIGNPVGFISLEMSIHQLVAKIMAIDSNFHLGQLLKTGFDKPQYFESFHNHADRIGNYPIYVDDSGASDISDVVILARLWKRKYGIKMLVVDYMQLMSDKSKGNNREQEISSISRRLKLLAKELEIPIIALAQLSRAVETRSSVPRPKLSDLRESGSIEQDADIVEFIFRPEYYNIPEEEWDEMMRERGANTEIIFAKYRGGGIGTSFIKWIGDKTKFIDPTDENEHQHREAVSEYVIRPATAQEAFGETNNDGTPF